MPRQIISVDDLVDVLLSLLSPTIYINYLQSYTLHCSPTRANIDQTQKGMSTPATRTQEPVRRRRLNPHSTMSSTLTASQHRPTLLAFPAYATITAAYLLTRYNSTTLLGRTTWLTYPEQIDPSLPKVPIMVLRVCLTYFVFVVYFRYAYCDSWRQIWGLLGGRRMERVDVEEGEKDD